MLFAGTPAFARASLEALTVAGHRPAAVLTQPDRRAGRGKKLRQSPVKEYAIANDVDVLQPATLSDDAVVRRLAALEPDILVVAAYGLILPQSVLDVPAQGCLNVHASLLPRWRGAAPVQAAIIAGDRRTGISLMRMTAGLDCGPVYATADLDIGAHETAGELHDRLAKLGGELLVASFDDILAGRIDARAQDESAATYAPKVTTDDARLDWRLPAIELERRVRAFNPVPGAWFLHGDERIKCWRAGIADGHGEPGSVLAGGAAGVIVACGSGALALESLQRPGRRPVSGGEFAAQLALDDVRFG